MIPILQREQLGSEMLKSCRRKSGTRWELGLELGCPASIPRAGQASEPWGGAVEI